MASSYTQDKRIGKLETPLGKDKLALLAFEGSEGMSEVFEFRVEAVSRTRRSWYSTMQSASIARSR